MKSETEKWKLESHSHQIADTGDYDGYHELTNGKISIFTKDDEVEELQKIVEVFNNSDSDFYLDDSLQFELHLANERIKLLEARCGHNPVHDLKDGRYHCIACYQTWTYEEWQSQQIESKEVQDIRVMPEVVKKLLQAVMEYMPNVNTENEKQMKLYHAYHTVKRHYEP